jgi:mono/diheme cytochrome c family protein
MTTVARKKSPAVPVLFAALLLVAAVSAVYAFFHPGPWIVPEEAKRRVNPLTPSQVNPGAARQMYLDKCAECHGDSGKGDGSQAKMYDPLPSNLADAQHMSAVSDGELFYKISDGHRPMPSFKKRFSEEQRWQLVFFIRSFSASPAPGQTPPK